MGDVSGAKAQRSFHYGARDGLMLHARITGDIHGPALPVVCLPGLTRNSRDFDRIAAILSADARRPRGVVAFDYRGRGLSARDPDWRNYAVPVEADDVLAGLAALDIGKAHLVGTSRGGLIIHVLAAMRPGLMASITLNDVGPEIGGAGLMQIRTTLDRMPKPRDWDEAARWLTQVHGKAFPALSAADFEHMARCVFTQDGTGGLVADHDPALLNPLKAIDFSAPLPTLWPQFAGLTDHAALVLRGENSALLTAETLARMQAAHPRLRAITVAGQGHAPLLETGTLPAALAAHFDAAEG